jgi:hypothetical protein
MTGAGSAVPAGKSALTARRWVIWATYQDAPGHGNAACLCTLSRTGIARGAPVRNIGGWGGTVLGLVERVRAIIMTPQAEWPVIANESSDALAIRYIAILALIPALARLVGGWLIGGYTPLLIALIGALVAYALSFVVVFVVALAVDLFAPKFGGERGYSSALRLTAYSFTPVWLAGIFLLVPGASFLVLLGLYGFYLMWLGLPVLMKAPRDRALPYVLAVAACAIVLDVALRLALIVSIGAAR